MTCLSSFMCPQCKKRHYVMTTVKDDYTCLYCGKDMNTGKQKVEPVYDVEYTDKGIDIHKLDTDSGNTKSDTYEVFERLYKRR